MSQTELKVWERDTTLTPRQLRAAGYVPATLYGKGVVPTSLQVRSHDFCQQYLKGSREFQLSGFLNATVDIRAAQMDPVHGLPLSIQFWQQGAGSAKPGKKGGKEAALTGAK